MQEEIEGWEARGPHVQSISGRFAVIWVGDEVPARSALVRAGELGARVVEHLGGRKVRVEFVNPPRVAVGTPVELTQRRAELAWSGVGWTSVGDLHFVGSDEELAAGTPRTHLTDAPSLPTGIAVIDDHFPLVRGGVNVLVEPGGPRDFVASLVGALPLERRLAILPGPSGWEDVGIEGALVHSDDPDLIELGFNAIHRVSSERPEATLLIVETSDAGDLDEWLEELHPAVTVLARVTPPRAVLDLAETWGLGHTDCQLMRREDGSLDLGRCHSRVDTDAITAARDELMRRARRAADVAEKRSLFGDDDLEAEELDLLEAISALERSIVQAS